MKLAVLGAGALGCVYGVRLAMRGNVDVAFVVRPQRAGDTSTIAIEGVRSGVREEIAAPTRSAAVPPDADVILLTVGTEDVEGLTGLLGSTDAPIVILTPMMPQDFTRMRAAFGKRALSAMPNVIAYVRDGVVRYWTAPAPTRIDESPTEPVRELTEALSRAGLRGHLELGVHETNPATTVCYIAIGMALAAAGSAAALTADDTLLSITTRACREGVRLSHRIGRAEPWALLAPIYSAPWALRAWLGALGRLSPEALFYAEDHFARKLVAQHRYMLGQMIDLAAERQLPNEAMRALAARLMVEMSDRGGHPAEG